MIEIRIVYPHINFNIRCTSFSLETRYFSCCLCTLLNNSYLGIYMYRKQQQKKKKERRKKEKEPSKTRSALTELLTVVKKKQNKTKKNNANAFHGNE